jgi:hypothetical protein
MRNTGNIWFYRNRARISVNLVFIQLLYDFLQSYVPVSFQYILYSANTVQYICMMHETNQQIHVCIHCAHKKFYCHSNVMVLSLQCFMKFSEGSDYPCLKYVEIRCKRPPPNRYLNVLKFYFNVNPFIHHQNHKMWWVRLPKKMF